MMLWKHRDGQTDGNRDWEQRLELDKRTLVEPTHPVTGQVCVCVCVCVWLIGETQVRVHGQKHTTA